MNQYFFEESIMKIRYAELFDAVSIARIHCESWQTTYVNLIPQRILQKKLFSQEKVDRWQNRLLDKKNIVLVAENEQGIVVGFAWGGAGRDERIPLNFELYALYIAESEQNRGYGSALLKKFAQEVGETFYLFALNGNDKAEKFYIHCGGILKPEYTKKQEDDSFVLLEDCFFLNNF